MPFHSPHPSHFFEQRLWTCPIELGHLEGELTLPAQPSALLLLLHNQYFRSDRELSDRLPALHQLGFATLACNIQNLHDLRLPNLLSDVTRSTDRLLHILESIRRDKTICTLRTILCVDDELTPAAIRSAVIRDMAIDAIICRGGLPDLAGKRFLTALEKPVYFQSSNESCFEHAQRCFTISPPTIKLPPPTPNPPLLPDESIHWITQQYLLNKS